jgi:hypothetical protein
MNAWKSVNEAKEWYVRMVLLQLAVDFLGKIGNGVYAQRSAVAEGEAPGERSFALSAAPWNSFRAAAAVS